MGINTNFLKLKDDYLFEEIKRKIENYKSNDVKILDLSIGDTVLPQGETVVNAIIEAARDMGSYEKYCGYPPNCGYTFLRQALGEYYASFGAKVQYDEFYISDGAKNDCAGIIDLFDNASVIMQDPVYPVYYDACTMRGFKCRFVNGDDNNGFLPLPSELNRRVRRAVIYLCSPNNPTGECYNREQLKKWVDYALETDSLIVFDNSYEAYISQDDIPHSIYEVDRATKCCIEIGSLSKSFGFTGLRCSYTIIPKELSYCGYNIEKYWKRRQSTKFNGVSYITQRAAQAALTKKGIEESKRNVDVYKENARNIKHFFVEKAITCYGGDNSPYVWVKAPINLTSFQVADDLLRRVGLAVTPGRGFGENGEGYYRLTGYSTTENNLLALEKLNRYYSDFDHFYN